MSKNKIWDILGNFDHNLAFKKGCKNEVYCCFWGILDHCASWTKLKSWTKLNIEILRQNLKIENKGWPKMKNWIKLKTEKLNKIENWTKLKNWTKVEMMDKIDSYLRCSLRQTVSTWFILGSWQWPECGKLLRRHGQHLFGQHRWRDWRGIEGSMDAVSSILQAKSPLLLQRGNDKRFQ